MTKQYYVYFMASKRNGTIYVGVTSDLKKRVYEHKNQYTDGFTKRYGCKNLVWFEVHANVEAAIMKEKQIKNWKREWKINRINDFNPDWRDLYDDICE